LAAHTLEGVARIDQLTLSLSTYSRYLAIAKLAVLLAVAMRSGLTPFNKSGLVEMIDRKAAPSLAISSKPLAFHIGNSLNASSGAISNFIRVRSSSFHSIWTFLAPASNAFLATLRTKSAAEIGALITSV